jgi:hypothetical protein
LIPERAAIQKALRRAGYFVAGMEDFTASPIDIWDFITELIDDSDYYLLVIAGKYGTLFPNSKMSFTEKEYRYALERQKPCVALIHDQPGIIQAQHTDMGTKGKSLQKFREFVASNNSASGRWHNLEGLPNEALAAIRNAERSCPGVGWVRADKNQEEIDRLKNQLHEFETAASASKPLFMTEEQPEHVRTEEPFTICYVMEDVREGAYVISDVDGPRAPRPEEYRSEIREISVMWQDVCLSLEIPLIKGCTEGDMQLALSKLCREKDKDWLISESKRTRGKWKVTIDKSSVNETIRRLSYLSFIESTSPPYWRLTEKGKIYFKQMDKHQDDVSPSQSDSSSLSSQESTS